MILKAYDRAGKYIGADAYNGHYERSHKSLFGSQLYGFLFFVQKHQYEHQQQAAALNLYRHKKIFTLFENTLPADNGNSPSALITVKIFN